MATRTFLVSLLLSCLLALAACSPPNTQTPPTVGVMDETPATTESSPTATDEAVLRAGINGAPDSLNPGAATLNEAYILFGLVYDSLYEAQLNDEFTPELAEKADTSRDGKVWTFTLHDGVTFHDGEPLTADDVVFSYNLYKEHDDFPLLNIYTEFFDEIEAVDDHTVVLTLTEAVPNFPNSLVNLYILPEHIWGELEEEDVIEFENSEMIGSGPFKLVEYRASEFARLETNKEHYLYDPKIDGVIFQIFANEDAMVQAIRTSQVDMINEMPRTAVATLRNEPDIEVVVGPPASPSMRTIYFNQVAPENCPPDDGVCSGHPALRDRNVRLALAHATDKQKLIDVALLGLGTPGLTLVPEGLGKWYNNTIQDYQFDIAEANRILDEAGYADADGDGVRDMPDKSQPLEFRFYWPDGMSEGSRLGELLDETWSQAGVRIQSQSLDADALISACCPGFDYDIIAFGWGSDLDPGGMLSIMLTSAIPDGSNETGYSNPEFDTLYEEQATEIDEEKRRELVWEMQEIVHRDVVYIIPYYQQNVEAYRSDRFTGWLTSEKRLALEDRTSLTEVEPVR